MNPFWIKFNFYGLVQIVINWEIISITKDNKIERPLQNKKCEPIEPVTNSHATVNKKHKGMKFSKIATEIKRNTFVVFTTV